jgi:hypothetical protein
VFECHANFHINWESFAHKAPHEQKHVKDMLPLHHGGDKCQVLVCELVPL